jgi:protein-S-isoprenylcysteine O-methyltransferase Ste14
VDPQHPLSHPIMHLSVEAIAKSAWLFAAATGVYLSILPPQPMPRKDDCKKFEDSLTTCDGESRSANQTVIPSSTPPRFDLGTAGAAFTLSYFPYIFTTWVAFMAAIDTFHALDLLPQIMPVNHTTAARSLNAQLIAGLVITIASTALRFASFQTLGKLFTFQLSILPEHKLVTSGVYSYVRHPSYTATPFIFGGVMLIITAPGSVLYDYLGVDATRKLMGILTLANLRGSYVLVPRAEVEDQVMRKEFGKEWEEWARVVKYKFIPGVF